MANFKIRRALPEDVPFIYDSWLKSYRRDSVRGKEIAPDIYFRGQQALIDSVLANTDTQVYVACNPNQESVIYGYLVCTCPDVLHYVFVKEAFGYRGIATQLFRAAFGTPTFPRRVIATHATGRTKRVLSRHPEIVYDPYPPKKPQET